VTATDDQLDAYFPPPGDPDLCGVCHKREADHNATLDGVVVGICEKCASHLEADR
jgi:hypothetical protein